MADPQALLDGITAAGAIFMGAMSSEALGDYCAGPNHVLPTAGSRALHRLWVSTISSGVVA